MADKQPPQREPTLRLMAMPTDTNAAGDIFGGWIMAQADIAGAIEACRYAQGPVVTVAVNAFRFHQPVYVGDVVSFYAHVVKTGTTSITSEIEVFVERNASDPIQVRVTEARLTYVAIDEQRRPRPLRPDTPPEA